MARHQTGTQLGSADMANDTQIVIRVPQAMAEGIKAYAEQLSAEVGVPVSVAAATRKLLSDALASVGHGDTESSKPKRGSKR
jgi:hypothetical protein